MEKQTFNILDFGAKQTLHDNSFAIEQAINEASKFGGIVLIPKGTFRSGSIILKSNLTLHLEKGAILKAGDDLKMFDLSSKDNHKNLDIPSYLNCDYNGKPTLYFIYANNIENVKIEGEGAIDGNEEIFYGKQDRYFIDGAFYPRMPLLYLEAIENLEVSGVTLQNSAFWTLHMVGCHNVHIHHLFIRNNLRLANCDGIDPDHCHGVDIHDCDIICADDAIVFKNTEANQKYGDCERIKVRDCSLKSTSAAIKFGSESFGDFHDIHLENIRIYETNRGISFQLRDDGNIYDCSFKNIRLDTRVFAKPYYWGYGDPIAITSLNRNDDIPSGEIYNISFENIVADSEAGIFIYGEDVSKIHDISFKNVELSLKNKSKWPKDKKDLRPYDKLPFIDSKINAIYLRNANKISFENFVFSIDSSIKPLYGQDFDFDNYSLVNVNGIDY